LLAQVDVKKAQLDQHRPLPALTAKSLRDSLALEWTYHSNAIEGNTLTLIETKVILEDGITIGGKTVREHLEAINHKEAINFLELMAKSSDTLHLYDIKKIHKIILRTIDDRIAGNFRAVNVRIVGANFSPPNHLKVGAQMNELISWYQMQAQELHPIERASQLHTRFVTIHPFEDGNGRTARLLLNLELIKNGYPFVIIKNEDRVNYFNALDDFHTTKNHHAFTKMVALYVVNSIDTYLKVITGEKQQPIVINNPKQSTTKSRGR